MIENYMSSSYAICMLILKLRILKSMLLCHFGIEIVPAQMQSISRI